MMRRVWLILAAVLAVVVLAACGGSKPAPVTATKSAVSSARVVTRTVGPAGASRVIAFCNIAAAYTDLTTGPHLCGWPDSTNTGYVNAPGYPGSLTTASSGSSTCPTTPQSNHTYEFCDYVGGLNLPAGLTNVTFYGDEFYSTNPNEANVAGGRGDNNITFDYDTFQPEQASPPVTCAESYEYGISNEGGQIGKLTVEHSNFWGFAVAVDTEGSTQANPQVMSHNWIHDASASSGCGYHLDGIGMLGTGTEEYAVVDHNTIEFTADTNGANLIAWQNGTYAHDQNTNNLLSGDGEGYAGGRCTSSCTQPSYITSTGNTYSTYLQASSGEGPIDGASNFWSGTGDVWNHNYWAVPPARSGEPPHTTATTGYPPGPPATRRTAVSSARPTTPTTATPAIDERAADSGAMPRNCAWSGRRPSRILAGEASSRCLTRVRDGRSSESLPIRRCSTRWARQVPGRLWLSTCWSGGGGRPLVGRGVWIGYVDLVPVVISLRQEPVIPQVRETIRGGAVSTDAGRMMSVGSEEAMLP